MEKNLERLNKMKEGRYLYRDNEITFSNFIIRGAIIIFIFDDHGKELLIEKDTDKVSVFLDCLKPVINGKEMKDINTIQSEQAPADTKINLPDKINWEPEILKENKQMLIGLRDMLLDDMKKVRVDKDYIPQAKQACNTANSIINLAKLEIIMLRMD